jgi:hypothetical protein
VLSPISHVPHTNSPEVAASPKLTAADHSFSEALTQETSTVGRQVSANTRSGVQFFGGWTVSDASQQAPKPRLFETQPAAPAAAPAETQSSDPAPAPFVPQFLTNVVETSAMGGSWPLNPDYFATEQTAQYIADKFGTGQVTQVPFGGTGGPYTSSAEEYDVVLANGATVNAGLLADYYVRMPESQCPGLADTMIQQAVVTAEKYNG